MAERPASIPKVPSSNPGPDLVILPLLLGFQAMLLLNIEGIRINATRVSAKVLSILFRSCSAYCGILCGGAQNKEK